MSSVERVIDAGEIRLRIWDPADHDRIAEIVAASRTEFDDWLPNLMQDLTDIGAFLTHVGERFAADSAFYYAIEVGGEAVGQVSLHKREDGTAEIGYWVCTSDTGRGLATRAVVAVRDAAFRDGDLRELIIHCDEGNHRSAAVARKAGFAHVRTVDLDPNLPGTRAQTWREMTWTKSAE
jgi:RimJ/RimL family protein N-acetyltransferase